jgi:pimeloyl-ACP methyl ester carboxylesterase
MCRWLFSLLTLLVPCALAVPHDASVPVHDGKIRFADLSQTLLVEMHCPKLHVPIPGDLNVRGLEGSHFVDALNHALGDACRVTLNDDALILHTDCDKLPKDWDTTKVAIRIFTTFAAPESTAAQRRDYGLKLDEVDDDGRLVILIHGLDSDRRAWTCLAPLLKREGYKIAYFNYPAAGPIADSAELLTQEMFALRKAFPNLKVDIITQSMGALVARSYVEGPQYAGGVDHLLLMTPPNNGSSWASAELALKVQNHIGLWRTNPDWHWTWMLTDGLGEAARDLTPGSQFLTDLSALPRRPGVKYTIIAGNQNPGWRIAANTVEAPARWVPNRAANWWGIRHCRHGLEKAASSLRTHTGKSDGPVSLASTELAGVTDVVIIPADHCTMYESCHNSPPASWETLKQRLAH